MCVCECVCVCVCVLCVCVCVCRSAVNKRCSVCYVVRVVFNNCFVSVYVTVI